MKKSLVTTSIVLMVFTTVFASDSTNVNHTMKEALLREYPGALSAQWQKTDEYQIATFGFNGHLVMAYFTHEGELLGSARDLLFNELPLVVMRTLQTSFADLDYTEIVEIANGEGTFYKVTAEKQDKRLLLKINSDGNIVRVVKKRERTTTIYNFDRAVIKQIGSVIEYFFVWIPFIVIKINNNEKY